MKVSSCKSTMPFELAHSQDRLLYSSFVANCIFNVVLSYTAIMLNAISMYAMTKTLSLPKNLKFLLMSLAVSDFGVGLLVQPLYASVLVKWLQRDSACVTYTAFVAIMTLFTLASFFSVTALSADRFLVIHLHLRYQELVTHRRVLAVVISIWLFSAFLTLFDFFFQKVTPLVVAVMLVVCFISTTVFYVMIYLAVRRHRSQIQALQVPRIVVGGEHVPNVVRLGKSAVGPFYVYVVFLLCFLPQFCFFVTILISGPNSTVEVLLLFSWTQMFLTSTLNPLIYCWKMKRIRRIIMDILRNAFSTHN